MKIKVKMEGLRPLMFDRYPGDNSTSLPVLEKLYLTEKQQLIMPALNVYSMLAAENTKSVCRHFLGKVGKTIALGIAGYVNITPFEIPIIRNDKWLTVKDNIRIHKTVARVKNGIPNPKERPVVDLPWAIEFEAEYQDNKYCSLENLRQAFDMGGSLGLGTFRPYFGRYRLICFDEIE